MEGLDYGFLAEIGMVPDCAPAWWAGKRNEIAGGSAELVPRGRLRMSPAAGRWNSWGGDHLGIPLTMPMKFTTMDWPTKHRVTGSHAPRTRAEKVEVLHYLRFQVAMRPTFVKPMPLRGTA